VIGKELALLAWPRWLSCDYSYDEIPLVGWTAGAETAKAAVALALIVALAAVVVRARRTRPSFAFLIAFFFVALLPTSNLLLVIGSIMAERFLYLPSVAFAAALSLATFALFDRARVRGGALAASAVLAAVALAYGARTVLRNRDWQDGVRLQASAVAAAPNSFKTHYGLAAALYANDAPEFRNIDAVIAEGEAALAIIDAKPLPAAFQPAVVPEHLGIYYWRKAETLAAHGAAPSEGERWYTKAVALLSRAADLARVEDEEYRAKRRRAGRDVDDAQTIGSPTTYRYLGLAYLRLGRQAEALEAFASQRGLQPDDADVYHEIAAVHAARGDLEGAATALFEAFAIAGPTRVVQPLLDVYRRMDGGECARGDDGGINLACPAVHRDVCRAYGELEGIFAVKHLDGNARHVRDQALRHLACPPGTFVDR
jgi:tetratricopeptide (TPR) repeat protein